nr:MAG TPA: antitoxin [Bacteriophage sp.]
MKYKALRNVMHAKEVTQKELAKVIGVAPSTMSFNEIQSVKKCDARKRSHAEGAC